MHNDQMLTRLETALLFAAALLTGGLIMGVGG
jgi:hypothetical protein